ncbi:MAG: sigma-70 family RNA polymerase sigma factor [Planctomycetota bacterium]
MTPHELESLLAQDDWLRRLARRLVRDPELADELAQEAWLAGLRRGRTSTGDRPWLFGVLRNARRDHARTEDRQRDRALRSEPDHEAPPTDEVAADLQLRARVTAELDALEEPYRTALYLRFVKGMTVTRAARETGVAKSTFVERMDRGLARLRRRLDRASGGDRRAWAQPMLLMARPEGAVAVLAGGVAMAATWKGAAIAAGVIGLSFLAARTPNAEAQPVESGGALVARADGPAAEHRSESLSSVKPDVVRRSRASTLESAPDQDAVPVGTATIVGRIVLDSGEPDAGAVWTLRARPVDVGRLGARSDLDAFELDGTVGADGALAIEVEPSEDHKFDLRVALTGRPALGWARDRITFTDLGTVTLPRAGRVVGRVVDEDGNPLTEQPWRASVRGPWPKEPWRDPLDASASASWSTAAFEVVNVHPGPSTLKLRGGLGVDLETASFEVEPGETTEVDVVVPGARALARRVHVFFLLEPMDWLPWPDPKHVRLVLADGTECVSKPRLDRFAGVRFDDVPSDAAWIEVDDPRFEPVRVVDFTPGRRVDAALVGRAGLTLDVRNREGRRVEGHGVEIVAYPDHDVPRTFVVASADDPLVDGRVGGLVGGTYEVVVRRGSEVAWARIEELGDDEVRSISLTLEPVAVVSGRVLDSTGSAVANATVRLVEPGRENDSLGIPVVPSRSFARPGADVRIEHDRAGTDADGAFRFEVVRPGSYLVLAGMEPEPLAQSETFDLRGGGTVEGLTIVRPAGARVRGRLRAPEGVELEGSELHLVRAREPGLALPPEPAILAADGSFDLGTVAAGRVELHVLLRQRGARWAGLPYDPEFGGGIRPRGARHVATLDLVDGSDESFDLTLAGPRRSVVHVRVDLLGVEPMKGTLTLEAKSLEQRDVSAVGVVPDFGPFLLDPGTYAVHLRGDDLWARDVADISVVDGVDQTVELSVHVVEKRIRLTRGGEPSAGQRVSIEKEGARTAAAHRAGEGGELLLRLVPGTYVLRAMQEPRLWSEGIVFDWPLEGDVLDLAP